MLIIPKVISIPLVASYRLFTVIVSLCLPDSQQGFVAEAKARTFPNKQKLLRDCSHGMCELFTWHQKALRCLSSDVPTETGGIAVY